MNHHHPPIRPAIKAYNFWGETWHGGVPLDLHENSVWLQDQLGPWWFMNAVFFAEWLLILPSQHREYFISHEIKILSWTNQYQVIQIMTFLSPNVGGHQQPLKGSRELTIPKKVNAWITRYFMPGTPNNQFFNGCFNWIIPNYYIKNGWKSPFPSIKNWFSFGFQVVHVSLLGIVALFGWAPDAMGYGQETFLVPKWPLFLKANPLQTRPKLQAKQGAPFGFQVYIDKNLYLSLFV